MTGFDCNCFVGNWPFHKVRNNTLDALRALHEQNDIGGGFVSSTDAIFFNDPFEADEDLHAQLTGTPYQHVITINPTLPGYKYELQRAAEEWGIAGVRIFPGFHGYEVMGSEMRGLAEQLDKYGLLLFLHVRMEDERMTYLLHPQTLKPSEMAGVLREYPSQTIVFCNMMAWEAKYLGELLTKNETVFLDCSGLRDGLFNIDELHALGVTERMVYGSCAPVFCMKSSHLLIDTADIPEETKRKIFTAETLRKKLKR